MQPNGSLKETPSVSAETAVIHQKELQDVEDLVSELKRLLVRYEKALTEEGISEQVETLERWMESYRRGLAAANKIAGRGMDWLPNLRDRLKLAADEMQRLESEGGNPGSKEQTERVEEFLKAVKSIDRVIPDLRQLFATEEQ